MLIHCDDLDAMAVHNWPVAAPYAYPVFGRTTPEQTLALPAKADLLWMEGRAGRCWGKSQKSSRMAHVLHLPLEPGEAPLCVSTYNSSCVTMRVRKKPSPMS